MPRCAATHLSAPRPVAGVIMLGLLIALALSGIELMAAVDSWTLIRQRDREQQLLFVGTQYREAIRRYWFAAPSGTSRVLPRSLDVLLEDDRYTQPVRHLRRLYPDPITGSRDWGLVRDGDGILGVYSPSEALPVKQAGFGPAYESFNGTSRYRDWVFAFSVPRRPGSLPTPAPGAPLPSPPLSTSRPVRGKTP